MIRNRSIFILIHLFQKRRKFFLMNYVSSWLNHSFHFIKSNSSIIIYVKRIKCLINVEKWSYLKSLSYSLTCYFNLEMSSPHWSKFNLSVLQKAIISFIKYFFLIVGISFIQHLRIIWIHSKKGITKFCKCDSSIMISIISCNE